MKKLYLFLSLFIIVSISKADWIKVTSYPATNAKDIIEKNGVLYAGASGSGVYVSSDNGVSWSQRNTGLTTPRATVINQIAYLNSGLFIATNDGIFKSTNNGLNWIEKNTGLQIGPGAIYYFAYSLFEDGSAIYAGTYNSIYKSTDNGDSWQPIRPLVSHADIVTFHKYNNLIMAGTSGNGNPLIATSNGGSNWISLQLNGGFSASAFCVYSEPGKIYVGTAIGIFVSTNSGANWVNSSSGLGPDPYIFSMAKVNTTLLAATNNWVYKTTNNGSNWKLDTITIAQTFQDVNKILVYGNRLYAGSTTGLYYRNIDDLLTGVENQSGEIPTEYKLNQNYPNPFNPTTKIEYQIPKESHVMIRVYDFTGKEVQTLVNESKTAGSYAVEFNAAQLSSGVYFYKLEADNFSIVKKMTLLK